MAVDPLSDLRAQLDAAASDPSLTPGERALKLRGLRERLVDLAGTADRYLGDLQNLRESEASDLARDLLWARGRADLRETLVREGSDPHELDEAGYLSHDELDRLAEEGLLVEALSTIKKILSPQDQLRLHPHGGHGRFKETYTSKPKPPPDHPPAPVGAVGAPHPTHVYDDKGQVHEVDQRYRDYFKHDPEATVVHADRLQPTRKEPQEKVDSARQNADAAKAGTIPKRKPLDATENGDGTLSIVDGNATHAALSAEGLTHFPVKITPGNAEDIARGRVADELAAGAAKAEPTVTKTLEATTTALGGKLEGLQYRLKSHESLISKIKRKQDKYPGMKPNEAGSRITDALRYTAVFPSQNYTEGVQSVLDALDAQGFQVWMKENYWGGRDDYNGFHANLSGPDGTNIELQFHTPDSLSVKEQKQHPIYEKFRESKDSHERWLLWQEMVANAAAIEQPPNVDQLGGATQHPAPAGPATGAKRAAGGEPATLPVHEPDLVTGDVKEALVALSQGKHVELDHADRVGTLLDELNRQVKEAEAKGETAPNIDLCNVSVKGENIFCVTHQGIPRLKMPQLKGQAAPGSKAAGLTPNAKGDVDISDEFRKHLTSKGIKVTSGTTKASRLRASQRELNGAVVAAMAQEPKKDAPPIFTSRDGYIVDGHHRWASTVGRSGGKDAMMKTDQIDMPILELLNEANAFTKDWGITPQSAEGRPRRKAG